MAHIHSFFTLFNVFAALFSAEAYALSIPNTQNYTVLPRAPPSASGTFPLVNVHDLVYATTINIAGQPFTVIVDTGSADLSVKSSSIKSKALKKTQDTGEQAKVLYADCSHCNGKILKADATIGKITVSAQAFMSDANPENNVPDTNGLLGLGPNALSAIHETLASTPHNGKTFLSNVFSQTKPQNTFMSFFLTRPKKLVNRKTTDGGEFTINEILPQYAAIQQQSKLPVEPRENEWATEMLSVTVNGKDIQLKSRRPGAPKTWTSLAILDTGHTSGLAPKQVVDAMYKFLPGAVLKKSPTGVQRYVLPCDSMVSVTLNFVDGFSIPMHPIDLIDVDSSSYPSCASTFGYADPQTEAHGWSLGQPFFKNVYALFDFGSFEDGVVHDPFIQLLGRTVMKDAQLEFKDMSAQRLKQFKKDYKP